MLRLLAVTVFGAVVAPTFLIAGLARADGATASLILVLEAPFTVVLARLLFREHLDRRVVAAICLVAIGAAVLVVGKPSQGSSSTIGVVLAGAAALAWALDNIVSRTLADLDPDLIVVLKGSFGASLAALAAVITGEALPSIGRMSAIAAVGTIGYGLSLRFYLRAQTIVGAARTASVFATAPFVGAFLAFLLGSAPSGWQLPLAGVLMFGGVVLHALERHKHRHAHESIEHEHLHSHDDGHHTHEHKPTFAGSHSHVHGHDPVTHEHEHSDDIHHRHGHRMKNMPFNTEAALLLILLISAGMAGKDRDAHANGAFPDSLQILTPADRPQQIVLSTNFGLILSDDGGQTWSWTCEQQNTLFANLYQFGPPSLDRLYVLSSRGLVYSDDGSCTWNVSGGELASVTAVDAFADPSDPSRVLAIARPLSQTIIANNLYASSDGGVTFGSPILTVGPQDDLVSVEISRSDPKVVYVAMTSMPGVLPRLIRSIDGGAHWDPPLDLQPMLGANQFRIIAIDPVDSGKIFLRVTEPLADSFAVSEDGGMTFRKPMQITGRLTAFARLASASTITSKTCQRSLSSSTFVRAK